MGDPAVAAVLKAVRSTFACAHTTSALRQSAAEMGATDAGALPPDIGDDTSPRPNRHPTLAHRLAAGGYRTGMAGLWSLGVPERLASAKEAKRVAETAPEKLGSANGGKLKRLVVAAQRLRASLVQQAALHEQAGAAVVVPAAPAPG